MRVLVTGSGGFVGPYLLNLLEKNGYEVFGMDKENMDNIENMYSGDILDKSFIEEVLAEILPDFLVHLAGFSSVKKSFDEPELCYQVNVEGTRNILEKSKILAKVPKLLIVSSAEVYGNPRFVPMTEEHSLTPSSPYGESRLAQEELIKEYTDDLEVIVARSFNHTGPVQRPEFVVSDFAKQIVEIQKGLREPLISVGNLEAIRDFTDVRDVVEAYYLILNEAKAGQVYNVCSGEGSSIRDILDKFIELSGVDIEVQIDPQRMRSTDIPELVGSHEKLTKDTGWKPEIPFEQTLNDMLHYWGSQIGLNK